MDEMRVRENAGRPDGKLVYTVHEKDDTVVE